jgi:hypothetical protein
MKTVVRRVTEPLQAAVEEVDVSGDAELEERYGLEIPVLLIDGKKVAKYRVSEDELKRLLNARAGTAGGAG